MKTDNWRRNGGGAEVGHIYSTCPLYRDTEWLSRAYCIQV